MAKIETNKAPQKDSNKQPKGTMPIDKLRQFKLNGNMQYATEYHASNIRKAAKSARMIGTYRQFVHNAPSKLPSCLRSTVHYFLNAAHRYDNEPVVRESSNESVNSNVV